MWREGPFRCVLLFERPDESCTLQLFEDRRVVREEHFHTTRDAASTAGMWFDAVAIRSLSPTLTRRISPRG